MPSINKVIIAGHLGRDPESRSFDNGGSVCNFSIATSEKWKDRQTGEPRERTDWHNIVCRNRLAEVASKYLGKGSPVLIDGRLRTRSYEKDGQTRYVTEVHADRVEFLGSRESNADDDHGGRAQNTQTQPKPAGADFEDDDIPF